MPKDPQPQQRIAPPLKKVQYLNTPMQVSGRDEDGFREISFIVGPTEQHTYTITPEAQKEMLKIFSGGIEVAHAGQMPKDEQ